MIKEVFVLLSNSDGTMRSIGYNEPFGVAVTTEKEAERFVQDDESGDRSYERLTIFDNVDDALRFRFGDGK